MRPRLFRAWDIEGDYMITSKRSIANIMKSFIVGAVYPDNVWHDYSHDLQGRKNYVIMEYTYKDDIGGKKIFEADYLEYKGALYIVEYCKYDLTYLARPLKETKTSQAYFLWEEDMTEYAKIIGNKFANPEILKETPDSINDVFSFLKKSKMNV